MTTKNASGTVGLSQVESNATVDTKDAKGGAEISHLERGSFSGHSLPPSSCRADLCLWILYLSGRFQPGLGTMDEEVAAFQNAGVKISEEDNKRSVRASAFLPLPLPPADSSSTGSSA